MVPNTKQTKCEKCGKDAIFKVNPDDWDDAPKGFTITRECSGRCHTTYMPVTPEQMHELTGLPVSGWSARGA